VDIVADRAKGLDEFLHLAGLKYAIRAAGCGVGRGTVFNRALVGILRFVLAGWKYPIPPTSFAGCYASPLLLIQNVVPPSRIAYTLCMDSFDFFRPPILTVTALSSYLRELLETDDVLRDVWVKGEISNFTQPRSGHLYFTLKDADAQIRAVMWKNSAMRLTFSPRDGQSVEVHGSMSFYPGGGQAQLYIDSMQPVGEGMLFQEFLRLKNKLEAEGLFDQQSEEH